MFTEAATIGSKQDLIVTALRQRLGAGGHGADAYLSERGVAREFNVSRMTARWAMRALVRSGHLQATPRRGYLPGSPLAGAPQMRIAWIKTGIEPPTEWARYATDMKLAVERKLRAVGGSVVSMSEATPLSDGVNRRLRAERVNAVILDCDSNDATLIAAGIATPCVLINTPTEAVTADVLVQDNAAGGYRVAAHLLDHGHRRIAWLGGRPGDSAHARERLGGFLSAFVERGLRFDPQWAAFSPLGRRDIVRRELRKLLALRPTAIATLWLDLAVWVSQALREQGLRVPEDVSVVAWGARESFAEKWTALAGAASPLPDAMHWSLEDLADSALSRLTERLRNPLARPVKIFVPVRLTARGSTRRVAAETPGAPSRGENLTEECGNAAPARERGRRQVREARPCES